MPATAKVKSIKVRRSVTFSGSMGGQREERVEQAVNSREVRKARMDCVLLTKSSHATPRSASYSRPKQSRSQSARPPQRSNSAHRLKEEAEADEKEKRAAADAAFMAWLKRKQTLPRQPRASPSREQLEQYTKDDARQRVLNAWHNKTLHRNEPSSPKANGSSE